MKVMPKHDAKRHFFLLSQARKHMDACIHVTYERSERKLVLQKLSTHWFFSFAALVKVLNESCAMGPFPQLTPSEVVSAGRLHH